MYHHATMDPTLTKTYIRNIRLKNKQITNIRFTGKKANTKANMQIEPDLYPFRVPSVYWNPTLSPQPGRLHLFQNLAPFLELHTSFLILWESDSLIQLPLVRPNLLAKELKTRSSQKKLRWKLPCRLDSLSRVKYLVKNQTWNQLEATSHRFIQWGCRRNTNQFLKYMRLPSSLQTWHKTTEKGKSSSSKLKSSSMEGSRIQKSTHRTQCQPFSCNNNKTPISQWVASLRPFTTQQINTTLTLPMHLHSFSASAAESIWQPPNQPFYYKPSINAAAPQCIKSLQCLVSTPENLNKRESVRELLTSQSSLSSQFLPSQSKSRRISQRRKNRYIKCASFKFQKNINTNLLQAQQFTWICCLTNFGFCANPNKT